jgi:endonuclease-3 related protein
MEKVNGRPSLAAASSFTHDGPSQRQSRTRQPPLVSLPAVDVKPEIMVRSIYRKLAGSWGPQHWWPAETAFEVIAGAILTQNTSWKNVERALQSLRLANGLSLAGIRSLPLTKLEELVRSSGYYRQKAARLKAFVAFVDERYGGSLEKMFRAPTSPLRAELLALHGIGPETADAILLYAAAHEVFVVDAYARRILQRHAAIEPAARYEEIRALVERALRRELPVSESGDAAPNRPMVHMPSPMSAGTRSPLAQVYNEMHGLVVQAGKHYCHREEPDCEHCPLRELLPR